MAAIPLEDNFTDIIGKAQRGLKLTDAQVSERAGVPVTEFQAVKAGEVNASAILKIAGPLGLGGPALKDSALKAWYPVPHEIAGLAQFNTPYEDMTVNAYVVWDERSREAIVFETGAVAEPILDFLKARSLRVT